jgi:hypothetical protein
MSYLEVSSTLKFRPLFCRQVGVQIRIFFGEGPRSRCYGRTAALRLIVQPSDEEKKDDQFFIIFPSNGAPVE